MLGLLVSALRHVAQQSSGLHRNPLCAAQSKRKNRLQRQQQALVKPLLEHREERSHSFIDTMFVKQANSDQLVNN
jgi:hypothetical protein